MDSSTLSATTPEQRLAKLGLTVPPRPAPIANFVTHVREGNILYLSGQGPLEADGTLHQGKVGSDVSVEEAYEHAKLVGLNLLAVLNEATDGDLSRVKRIVKLLGLVNADPDFKDHPKVINGCSDLLIAVFGDAGWHARSAIGQGSLPGNITVEIEAIVALKDD